MNCQTYWNGEPCPARIVRVIVGPCEKETFWHNGLEGSEREAVEVAWPGQPKFYLDNEAWDRSSYKGPPLPPPFERMASASHPAGQGWEKVTVGRGSPQWPHASLPVAEVIEPPANSNERGEAVRLPPQLQDEVDRHRANIDELERHAAKAREADLARGNRHERRKQDAIARRTRKA